MIKHLLIGCALLAFANATAPGARGHHLLRCDCDREEARRGGQD